MLSVLLVNENLHFQKCMFVKTVSFFLKKRKKEILLQKLLAFISANKKLTDFILCVLEHNNESLTGTSIKLSVLNSWILIVRLFETVEF